jgi:hypothetical protein
MEDICCFGSDVLSVYAWTQQMLRNGENYSLKKRCKKCTGFPALKQYRAKEASNAVVSADVSETLTAITVIVDYHLVEGHVVVQVVSRWFPTAEARVRAWVKSCRLCGRQRSTAAGFLRVLRFPLPLIHSANCPAVITIYHPGLIK